ncbi:hypothetical protein FQ087_12695 [Sporosarcina sp. ANT_H38]|uniref:hypothetical protein n=1 Tax=Sporosarcina sp. ANT_H38 TaxID=2597358 RepID=UPI0011F24365|nr:hypothetical protein [Sporosarcina sp. ANT_H38]KAA0955466.1 hypothetical protein FQ087_12695 [Sporosarcina sp. ANT_H38]
MQQDFPTGKVVVTIMFRASRKGTSENGFLPILRQVTDVIKWLINKREIIPYQLNMKNTYAPLNGSFNGA